jgi:hypothetical protein
LRDGLADLAGAEGAELRLPLAKLAELRLPAHCLLRKLLRRQVLDDLLQRLRALDRVHGLSCGNMLGGLDGRLDWIGRLLLRPKHIQLREILRPWVLRREGCVGNAAGTKAAISRADPPAADRAEDAGIELAADGRRIEQLGEVALVVSIGVQFCHVSSPCLLRQG